MIANSYEFAGIRQDGKWLVSSARDGKFPGFFENNPVPGKWHSGTQTSTVFARCKLLFYDWSKGQKLKFSLNCFRNGEGAGLCWNRENCQDNIYSVITPMIRKSDSREQSVSTSVIRYAMSCAIYAVHCVFNLLQFHDPKNVLFENCIQIVNFYSHHITPIGLDFRAQNA